MDRQNDYDALIDLLNRNNISYHKTPIYDKNNHPYPCIWLDVGHIEFDDYAMITNIVTF